MKFNLTSSSKETPRSLVDQSKLTAFMLSLLVHLKDIGNLKASELSNMHNP